MMGTDLERTSEEDPAPPPFENSEGELGSPTKLLSQFSESSVEASSTENTPVHYVKPYYCGFGVCRPKKLQWFASAKFFTFLLCINALIEGALVSGFTSVVLSTIEKRYRFSSLAASMIVAVFDLAVVVSVVFISYFGHKGHKPRWLGIGLIIQGIGAFIFVLPQFIFGEYKVGSGAQLRYESCDTGDTFLSSCSVANDIAYALFIFGNILIGIGASPLFTIGTSFIDDIVHPQFVSLHLGMFYMTAVVGPAIGYGLGGAFLSIYVDPWRATHLTESDPGWVGAWWLCFIFCGISSVALSIPFLMYPRRLKDSHMVQKARKLEMAVSYTSKYEHEESFHVQLKVFPRHLKKLFQSASYLFITFGISVLFFSLDGMVAFGPKYIESVYSVPASTSSILVGAVAIPTGGLGVLAGAVLVYFTKSKGKRLALIPWIVGIIVLFPTVGFLFNCPDTNIAGIHTTFKNSSVIGDGRDVLVSSCNYECMCNSSLFEPVCGADDLTYFSPCRAGCQKSYVDGNPDAPVFENCSCVAENSYHSKENMAGVDQHATPSQMYLGNSTASNGKCKLNCHNLGIFLAFVALLVFFIFLLKIPTILITIRAVADEQRSLSLGVQSVFFRVFGSIPGPIAFGAVIDSGCIYWQYECNRRGNCWVYNNSILGIRAFAIAISGLILNLVFSVLCWIFYPPIRCMSNGQPHDIKEDDEFNKPRTSSDSDFKVKLEGFNDDIYQADSDTTNGTDH